VTLWHLLAGALSPPVLRRAVPIAAGVALALAAGLNLWLYFVYMPGDPRVLEKFYVGETRAGYAIAAARARDPALVAYVPRAYLDDETLRFAAGQAPLRELPADGTELPPGPAMVVVPRGAEDQDLAQQLALARRVAAASDLRQAPRPPPPRRRRPPY